MTKRVAMVDTATWLFPQHTMDALERYFAAGAVDPVVLQQLVQDAVDSAIGGRDVQMRVTATEVQWRAGENDPWHTLLLIEDLNQPAADALAAHIISPTPHPAYDDMTSLTLIFENHLV